MISPPCYFMHLPSYPRFVIQFTSFQLQFQDELPKAQIVFSQDGLPSKDIQNHYDPCMIVVPINGNSIRRTLVDNVFGLNVCSIDLLDNIIVDTSLIQLESLSIHGFDNADRSSLGTVTFPIKIGLAILATPIQIMLEKLTYNLVLGRP